MKTFLIKTLGCKANQYDSMIISKELLEHGLKEGDSQADVVIINSCAVTKTAIQKNQRAINALKAKNYNAKIIVVGCWPRSSKINLSKDIVVITANSKDLIKLSKEIIDSLDCKLTKNSRCRLKFSNGKSRYTIKIQDGCEQYCTYCNIPYAHGKLFSRNEQEVIAEIIGAFSSGFNEVVICGTHLGLYGLDKTKQKRLNNLLKKLCEYKEVKRLRLSSIEINDLDEDLINTIVNNNKICQHLHVPLQSGCDKILKLMNRPYDTFYYRQKISKIRKLSPQIAITTDVIVGFPQESDHDFQDTCGFIKQIGFSKIHLFPFSPHSNTPAAGFADQVDAETKKTRTEVLRKISSILKAEYDKKFMHQKLAIIAEKNNNGIVSGKSEFYFNASGKMPPGCNYKQGGLINIKPMKIS